MQFVPQGIIDWIVEAIQRLGMKSPAFHKRVGMISNILMLLSGLPYLIEQTEQMFNWTAPEFLNVLSNKFSFGIGVGLKIAAKLAVKSSIVAQTEEGKAVMVTDEKKLPFTTKSEAKEVEALVPPPIVVTDVPEEPKEQINKP